jgi:hypothetical protein
MRWVANGTDFRGVPSGIALSTQMSAADYEYIQSHAALWAGRSNYAINVTDLSRIFYSVPPPGAPHRVIALPSHAGEVGADLPRFEDLRRIFRLPWSPVPAEEYRWGAPDRLLATSAYLLAHGSETARLPDPSTAALDHDYMAALYRATTGFDPLTLLSRWAFRNDMRQVLRSAPPVSAHPGTRSR